jgi:cytidylate kinase
MITISRQAGTGAHVLAEELVARLDALAPAGSCPWTVFDRNLVDRVLQDHDLPSRLAAYMPEDRASELSDIVDELFGLHPHSRNLVRKTADTILHLAELGNVVVIGRAGNVVTGKLDHAFHVRLVGSREGRIARTQEYLHLAPAAAADHVRHEDLARQRYVKKYYAADIDDPLLYHLVVNMDRVSHAEAARMIVESVYPRFGRGTEAIPDPAERLLSPA